ncbi:MAG: nucleoside/nucleotide kinase family protein [Planctomycetota bacterium]|jgi:dTMP kinase
MSEFVVFEGLDGCGKSTQMRLLIEHLRRCGLPSECLHFPRTSDSFHGRLIARFLRGELGEVSEVPSPLVAHLYAGDRADANDLIRKWRKQGVYVIVDRYVYSNMAYQAAKLHSEEEKRRLRDWIEHLEFGYYGLEKPDHSLYLHVPFDFIEAQLSQERAGRERGYLEGKRDIHESSLALQRRVEQEYLALCDQREDLALVPCAEGSRMLPPNQIHRRILGLMGLTP